MVNDDEYDVKPVIFLQGFDAVDVVKYIGKLTRRYQKNLMNDIETVLPPGSKEHDEIRKFVLDSTNNFSRSIVRSIFGNIET